MVAILALWVLFRRRSPAAVRRGRIHGGTLGFSRSIRFGEYVYLKRKK
ncbi:MAG: hypothetical protein U5R30_21840 [Deltaproteobacteria bacterium]|nr:hypothetical protein [Deltaproteobacteria bacterium]